MCPPSVENTNAFERALAVYSVQSAETGFPGLTPNHTHFQQGLLPLSVVPVCQGKALSSTIIMTAIGKDLLL